MPFIFNALSALNDTVITKLWIWDAHTATIPSDMFAQVLSVASLLLYYLSRKIIKSCFRF